MEMQKNTLCNRRRKAAFTTALSLLAPAAGMLHAANFSATEGNYLVIENPSALLPGDTITWAEQNATVWANGPIDQAFVDHFNPLISPVTRGYLNVRSNISSDLDFSGKGDIALAGRRNFDVAFSGAWTPDSSTYRVADGELTLSGTHQLTDVDGTTSRSLLVENATLTITGAQSFTGGITLTSAT